MSGAKPAVIRFENVYKAFGARQVLCGFSAELAPGGAYALMGPSGGGKTTALRLLLGLDAPDAGRVVGAEGLRFACVFQEDRLCEEFSAVENVALVLPRGGQGGIGEALAAVGLSDEEVRKPVAKLSGGERRRVALVRAVLAESDVLALDEAFKGLDAAARLRACDFVKEHLSGRTLVLVTHDADEARLFGARLFPVERQADDAENPAPEEGRPCNHQ